MSAAQLDELKKQTRILKKILQILRIPYEPELKGKYLPAKEV